MKIFVNSEEFSSLNCGFALDEGMTRFSCIVNWYLNLWWWWWWWWWWCGKL